MTTPVVEPSGNDISNKRRAVYAALFPYLSTEELLKAMWLWQENYSSGSGASIRQYVSEITRDPARRLHAKKIYNTIMSNFFKQDEISESDPIEMMMAYRSGKLIPDDSHAGSVLMRIPENIVFNLVMEKLHHMISKDDFYKTNKTKEYFSASIFKLDMDIRKTKEVLQWAQDYHVFIGMKYSTEEFSKILHIFYIGICEFFGPQKADLFLNTAIQEAANTAEGKQFSPKSFL